MGKADCSKCAEEANGCVESFEAMTSAALVLGFNEMAKNAETIGDKAYFRLCREAAHKRLREMENNHGYEITFAESAPDETK